MLPSPLSLSSSSQRQFQAATHMLALHLCTLFNVLILADYAGVRTVALTIDNGYI